LSEMITVRLNNFLFNAGVVGFAYMLENCKISKELYQIEGSELHIAQEFFTDSQYDLSQLYFQALRNRFEDDTAWKRLKDLEVELKRLDLNVEEGQTKFDQIINAGLLGKYKKLDSASYKSGYEIVKQYYGEIYDALTEWKNLKKEKDREVQRKKLLSILQYIIKYPEVFCYKDIAYNKITHIWNGVAFLYAQNSKKDMLECYTETFINPLKNYLNNPKNGKDQCIECGAWIKKDDAMGLSWLQMGVDHKRKKSYFWNMIPDSYLCPICALIYSYAPLGFVFAFGKKDAVFINNNSSILDLQRDNEGLAREKLGVTQNISEVCYLLTSQLIQKGLELKEHELDNIQVILRHVDKYEISIISKRNLEVLQQCRTSFEKLTRVFVKINEDFLNVYDEVLHNLLFGINNYLLMDKVLRLEQGAPRFLWHVLKIQIYSKGGEIMTPDKEFRRTKAIAFHGTEIRNALSTKKEDADNKVRGIVYQLLNALQVKDVHRFMDIALRLYTGLGKEIPRLFLQMFENDDSFRNLGYAFVLGLKGEEFTSNDGVKEDNNFKEEVAQ
jgi:CRISPR-associated protein Cst1